MHIRKKKKRKKKRYTYPFCWWLNCYDSAAIPGEVGGNHLCEYVVRKETMLTRLWNPRALFPLLLTSLFTLLLYPNFTLKQRRENFNSSLPLFSFSLETLHPILRSYGTLASPRRFSPKKRHWGTQFSQTLPSCFSTLQFPLLNCVFFLGP